MWRYVHITLNARYTAVTFQKLRRLYSGCGATATRPPIGERKWMNVEVQGYDDSLLTVFFFYTPLGVHAGTRACLYFEGEGVDAMDRRV